MCLVALLASGVSASGCGSSDSKKNAPRYDAGGEGGGGGIGDAGSGGTAGKGATSGSAGDAGSTGTAGDAGAGNGGGGDAGAGPVEPNGGASDGGAGGEGPVIPFHGLYVGEDGDDAAAGTIDAPFETLGHAASVAQAGDTIVFLDGSYAVGTVAAVIPAGVNLMAENSGAATLIGQNGSLLNLSGDTRIEGLRIQSYNRVAYFGAGATATGTVTLVDTTLVNCIIGLELSGTTSAVVDVADSFVLGNGGNAFVTLVDEASLDMTGGILQNYGDGGIIRARYDSTVSLTGVQVLDGTGSVLTLREDAVADLTDVTFATLGSALIEQYDSTELTISDSDLSLKPSATAYYSVSTVGLTPGSSLTITDSSLRGGNTAIRGDIYETMTITNVQFTDLSFGGMDISASGAGGGTIRITGSTFEDLGTLALRIGQGNNLTDVKIRDSSFSCASPANWVCLSLAGGNASTLDLGTVSDPGGNTFLQSSGGTCTALRIGYPAINTTAVGNTWTPNQQGADDQGKYNAPAGSGNKLQISTTNSTGRNYQLWSGGTLLLAENP